MKLNSIQYLTIPGTAQEVVRNVCQSISAACHYIITRIKTLVASIFIFFLFTNSQADLKAHEWKLNTSNQGKLKEFQQLFAEKGQKISSTSVDIDEPVATPLEVVSYKASQVGNHVLVEDTSFDVQDADIGINIRWKMDEAEKNIGKKAKWTVLLAYRVDDKVYVYEGIVNGKIVKRTCEKGFGFDPYFMPEGADKTLAEDKPNKYSARALAVKALLEKLPPNYTYDIKAVKDWKGEWQSKH